MQSTGSVLYESADEPVYYYEEPSNAEASASQPAQVNARREAVVTIGGTTYTPKVEDPEQLNAKCPKITTGRVNLGLLVLLVLGMLVLGVCLGKAINDLKFEIEDLRSVVSLTIGKQHTTVLPKLFGL